MRTEVLDSILHVSVCSRALNAGLEGMPSQAGSPLRRRNFYCCQVWVLWSWKPKRLSGHKARGKKEADGRGRLKKSLHVIVTPEKEGEGQKEPETAAQLCGRVSAILRGRCCTEMTRGGNLDWVEMVRPQYCPVLSLWPIAPWEEESRLDCYSRSCSAAAGSSLNGALACESDHLQEVVLMVVMVIIFPLSSTLPAWYCWDVESGASHSLAENLSSEGFPLHSTFFVWITES